MSEMVHCTICNKLFYPTPAQRHHAKHRSEGKYYCSKECSYVGRGWSISGYKYQCKTCGKTFYSRIPNKIYCNLKCYMEDPETKERLKNQSIKASIKSREKAGITIKKRVVVFCSYCKKELSVIPSKAIGQSHFFCNQSHYRLYLADRFDRWIASPQNIKEMKNYDEFMTQEELPCIIDGCNWSGKNLAYHVNVAHGINAIDFKKLAGFNLKTGLVTEELSTKMSDSAKNREDNLHGIRYTGERKYNGYVSNEAKEHFIKSKILLRGKHSNKIKKCKNCGKDIIQPYFGIKKYCSIECRDEYYKNKNSEKKYLLICSECGKQFMGRRAQFLRNSNNLAICCSTDCRNKRNARFLHRINS